MTAPLQSGQLRAGRYAYTSQINNKSGTLTITYSSPDSIAGTWAVAGYQAKAQSGRWGPEGYVLYALESGSENAYVHQLLRVEDRVTCRVQFGGIADCVLTYVGP